MGENYTTWENALFEARRFSYRWRRWEGDQEIKDAAYAALPRIVKDALSYLCEIGEID